MHYDPEPLDAIHWILLSLITASEDMTMADAFRRDIFTRVLALVISLKDVLQPAQLLEVAGFSDNEEYGIAIETIVDIAFEENVVLPKGALDEVEALAREMGIEGKIRLRLVSLRHRRTEFARDTLGPIPDSKGAWWAVLDDGRNVKTTVLIDVGFFDGASIESGLRCRIVGGAHAGEIFLESPQSRLLTQGDGISINTGASLGFEPEDTIHLTWIGKLDTPTWAPSPGTMIAAE